MRTENSLKNVFWSVFAFGVNLIVNFVARKIFIDILGAEYNGLNSLLTSIISILSIAELGIGTTIIFFLYEPIHKKNIELTKSLMNFYKKCYRIIAFVVSAVGVIIIPFLHSIIGSLDIDVNIYIAYILFLLEAVLSYLLSYKRSIIIADQKERITKYVHIGKIVLMNVVQILLLYLTKNFYLFLLVKVLFTGLENIIIAGIANKKYPYITEKAKPLPISIKKSLTKKIRAMFYHQIGGFVVNGTDNIMISMMFGVTQVGFYNNYFLVVSSIFNLISSVFSGITASIGNLLVMKNERSNLHAYRGIQAINFILAAYVSCTFYACVQPLVKIWIGDEYLMSELMVGTLSVYLYLRMMKLTTIAFKNAAGIFYEDRFIPIIESVVNIIASLICAKVFGVPGIIMGTIISTLVLCFGSYPFIVYRKIFNESANLYFKQHFLYLLSAVVMSLIAVCLSNIVVFNNSILELLKNAIISTIIFFAVFFVMYHANSSFNDIVRRILKKFLRFRIRR
ncbi:oligosaccharide flippase family protein [Candidatus Saccharibacteria bacterium]|nr:oligosaccharide flippase family protein [Candidatus Saccharibacteria bacterium]